MAEEGVSQEAEPAESEAPGDLDATIDPEISKPVDELLKEGDPTASVISRLEAHAFKESRYRFKGEIARGGMGAILKVWDEDLRRNLAMKVVLGRDVRGGSTQEIRPKVLARFLEEAQVTGQLDHPGIVPVHELGLDDDGRVYFTMRLVKGRNLRQVFDMVREGKEGWNQTRALMVMLKVCEAMAYAHRKGVIHRDLKPDNVMVGRYGEVYVMDWGLARVVGHRDLHDIRPKSDSVLSTLLVESDRKDPVPELPDSSLYTMDGDVIGTPAYMSPEQARGDIEALGPRADVYSVGSILYHLLSRQMPYVPDEASIAPHMILRWVLEGPPKPLHEVSKESPIELAAICDKAMARKPAERYADMGELAEDLRAFLEHRVVRAYQTGAVAEFRKWVQRNRGLAVSSAAAIVLALGGLSGVGYLQAKGKAKQFELRTIAEGEKQRAQEQEAIARAERSNVLRLSASQNLENLVAEAEQLWPATPDKAADYEDWLARANALAAGLHPNAETEDEGHYAVLEDLKQKALPADGGELRFASTDDQWWYDELTELIGEIESFSHERTGLIQGSSERWGWGIERRLAFVREVEELTVSGDDAFQLWEDAIQGVAESPLYTELYLVPQIGLLPLGADPVSGLQEFADVQTGKIPVRDRSGRLGLTEDSALVFVLLPGGTFSMGAQSTSESRVNFDPWAFMLLESPVRPVTLDPFFISKYEMTQAQWKHFTLANPSGIHPESEDYAGIDYGHPVENLNWFDCMAVLPKLGMTLPTEAQWEYAARGGTSLPWWVGDTKESLATAANLKDLTGRNSVLGVEWTYWEDFEDGYVYHAPVGSYDPNPFGLHDVYGNVLEWCFDYMGSYDVDPVKDGTGERIIPKNRQRYRNLRGGSYLSSAEESRSSRRWNVNADVKAERTGVRPARVIDFGD